MTATATSSDFLAFADFPTAYIRSDERFEVGRDPILTSADVAREETSLASSKEVVRTLQSLGSILADFMPQLTSTATCKLYADLTRAAEAAHATHRAFYPVRRTGYWWLPRGLSPDDISCDGGEWLSDVVDGLKARGFHRDNDPRSRR